MTDLSRMIASASPLDRLQVGIVLALLLCSVPALLLAYKLAWRQCTSGEVGLQWRRLAGLFLLLLLARVFLVEPLIYTVFIGYRWTDQCYRLFPLSHYGAGAQTFFHLLLRVLPVSHDTVMYINMVVGVLTLPLLAVVSGRLLGMPVLGPWVALLVGGAPLFIRNEASDANQVVPLWWMFGGLLLWTSYLKAAQWRYLLGCVPLLLLTCMSRPEIGALVGLLLLLSAWFEGRLREVLSNRAVWLGAAGGALLLVPHVLHILHETARLAAVDSLPGMTLPGLLNLPGNLWDTTALVHPGMYPLAYLVLAVIGAGWGQATSLRRRLTLAGVTLVALVIYIPDLDRANMSRVHVPAALFATMLAALGLSVFWRALAGRPLLATLTLAAPLLGSLYWTWVVLYQPTNEFTEERFIRRVLEALPKGEPVTLVLLDRSDRLALHGEPGFTHDHFPRYAITPPLGQVEVINIRTALERDSWPYPAYFFGGMRCYARFRSIHEPRPVGENLQPACEQMRQRFDLTPVLVERVRNYGDVWISYYGDVEELEIGLYQLRRR